VAGRSRTPTVYFLANFVNFVGAHPQRMLDTPPVTPLVAASLSIKNHSGPKGIEAFVVPRPSVSPLVRPPLPVLLCIKIRCVFKAEQIPNRYHRCAQVCCIVIHPNIASG